MGFSSTVSSILIPPTGLTASSECPMDRVQFSFICGLDDGGHTINVMVLDRAGNERTLSVSFTVSTGLIEWTEYVLVLLLAVAVAVGAVTYSLRSRKHRKS